MRMFWLPISAGLALLGACAGTVHNAQLDLPLGVQPGSYGFAALSPDGSDAEVRARALLASRLNARGFSLSATPAYLIEVAVSERPGGVGLYGAGGAEAPDAARSHNDIPPSKPFMGLCNDHAARLALVFTERATGRTVSAVRSGQLRCDGGLEEALPLLADQALAEALR